MENSVDLDTGLSLPPRESLDGKTCLVTGASGFMGKYMVNLLLERGATVVATDLAISRELPDSPRLLQMTADLTAPFVQNMHLVARAYDYVFHIAALFDYAAPYETLRRVNMDGTQNLIRLLGESRQAILKRIVFWGAGGMYDFAKQSPAKETSPLCENLQGYLLSKFWAENVFRLECGVQRLPFSVIRLGGVYGPGARYGVAVAMKIASQGGMGPLYIGPQNTRAGTVHAEDVCQAALFVAQQAGTAGETYNVTDFSTYTTAYLMRQCAAYLGFPMLPLVSLPMGAMRLFVAKLAKDAARLGRVPLLTPDLIELQAKDALLDGTKLHKLGWEPQHPDALVGLKATIDAERKAGWL